MVSTRGVEPLTDAVLEDMGMSWHTHSDGSRYLGDALVEVSEAEAEAYYTAANELYDLFVEAAQHVIDDKRYVELGIPGNLIKQIEHSWEADDRHLYGRFDFAGGLDGLPIKLIEFNADTPTSLFETAIVQWALLRANGLDEARQFNNLHDMLVENFRRLITGERPVEEFGERYAGEKLLFSSAADLPEDERTVRYLQQVAHDAGFFTDFCYAHEAGFSAEEGVFNRDGQLADFWFKLLPWEDIATDELELTRLLEKATLHGVTRMLNPAYTLLFQSKGLLKVLYELFPESPYLLPADFTALAGVDQVEKKLFGREGANLRLLSADGNVIDENDGRYGHHKAVFQQRAEFARDNEGRNYQAGVFYVWEACALSFRRGGAILDDLSPFVGHIIV